MGNEIAKLMLADGWTIGVAGRRIELLEKFRESAPDRIFIEAIDVCKDDAPQKLKELIEKTGGMDLYLHSSGVGNQNPSLDINIETGTGETNSVGFMRMVSTAFNYFRENGGGHIAAITSISGTKGLGVAPSYSATKRMQNTYLDALGQLAHLKKLPIRFTDIRPGFVATDFLNGSRNYPMLLSPELVARKAYRAIKRHRRVTVIDWRFSIIVFFWRLIPRCLWKRMPISND